MFTMFGIKLSFIIAARIDFQSGQFSPSSKQMDSNANFTAAGGLAMVRISTKSFFLMDLTARDRREIYQFTNIYILTASATENILESLLSWQYHSNITKTFNLSFQIFDTCTFTVNPSIFPWQRRITLISFSINQDLNARIISKIFISNFGTAYVPIDRTSLIVG